LNFFREKKKKKKKNRSKMSLLNVAVEMKDEKLMEGWLQREEQVTQMDKEWQPRWVIFTRKRWLVYESPYHLERALTAYSIPAISSLEFQRGQKYFSFATPASGTVNMRAETQKMRDKWCQKLRDIIPQAKMEQTREMLQKKAESQAAKEFAEIQRAAAFNSILSAEQLIVCRRSYRLYADALGDTLRQVIYYADVVIKEGMNAAKPLSETITALVDAANSTIAISRDGGVRRELVRYSQLTTRQAAEVLTHAKTAASSESSLQQFVAATIELKRIIAEFLAFLDRTSNLADIEEAMHATQAALGATLESAQSALILPGQPRPLLQSVEPIDDAAQPIALQRFTIEAAQAYQMPSAQSLSAASSALSSELAALSGALASAGVSASSSAAAAGNADDPAAAAALHESTSRVAFLLRSLVESAKLVCDQSPSAVRDGKLLDNTVKLAHNVSGIVSGELSSADALGQVNDILAQLVGTASSAQREARTNLSIEEVSALAIAPKAIIESSSASSDASGATSSSSLSSTAAGSEGDDVAAPEWLSSMPAPAPPPAAATAVPPRPPRAAGQQPSLPPRTLPADESAAAATSSDKARTLAEALQQVHDSVVATSKQFRYLHSAEVVMRQQQLSADEVRELKRERRAAAKKTRDPTIELIVDLPPELLDGARALTEHTAELLKASMAGYKEVRRLQKSGADVASLQSLGDETVTRDAGNPKYLVFAARLVLPSIKKLLRVSSNDDADAVVAAARLLRYTLAQLAASAKAKLPADNPAAQRLVAAANAVHSATAELSRASALPDIGSDSRQSDGTPADAITAAEFQQARSALVASIENQDRAHQIDDEIAAVRQSMTAVRNSDDAKGTKLSMRAKALEKEYNLQLQLARLERQRSRLQ
jgi:PH domain